MASATSDPIAPTGMWASMVTANRWAETSLRMSSTGGGLTLAITTTAAEVPSAASSSAADHARGESR